ncbi:MAG: M24 family metallopeptidase [Nanobdellota archaeon]
MVISKKTIRESDKSVAKSAGVDACLFVSTQRQPSLSTTHLVGVAPEDSFLLTFKRKRPLLIHSPLEQPPRLNNIDTLPWKKNILSSILKKHRVSTLGVCYDELTKKEFDSLQKSLKKKSSVSKLKDVSPVISKRRLLKTPFEQRLLQKAISRTEKIIAELCQALPSMTYEKSAIQFIKKRIIDYGDELSFEPIVASGRQSGNPHYYPSLRSRLKRGFCVIDMGVRHKGFCADITRTVFLGTPTKKEKEFYTQVQQEQSRLENNLEAGVSTIKTAFPMIHALGHGIGLEVHEKPLVGKDVLHPGMTIALEPGLYTPKGGVRIEDDYLVTSSGLKRLSISSRDLCVLPIKKS